MHHLDRACVAMPACLANPPEGWTYSDLRAPQTAEIRDALLNLQQHRCAYCERRTGDDPRLHGHIEHFRDQTGNDHLRMAWSNLFWSCNDQKTCGKHKDNCRRSEGPMRRFDAADLIDPAQDDPEEYLLFVSDGTVTPRPGLEPAKQHRAEETIRVFQLNESAYLAKSRHDAIQPYLSALAELGATAVSAWFARELAQVAPRPHSTAIRHFLSSVAP